MLPLHKQTHKIMIKRHYQVQVDGVPRRTHLSIKEAIRYFYFLFEYSVDDQIVELVNEDDYEVVLSSCKDTCDLPF